MIQYIMIDRQQEFDLTQDGGEVPIMYAQFSALMQLEIDLINKLGVTPIVLTSPLVRRHFKSLTSQMVPDLVVLSYNELDSSVEVFSDGVVSIQQSA